MDKWKTKNNHTRNNPEERALFIKRQLKEMVLRIKMDINIFKYRHANKK